MAPKQTAQIIGIVFGVVAGLLVLMMGYRYWKATASGKTDSGIPLNQDDYGLKSEDTSNPMHDDGDNDDDNDDDNDVPVKRNDKIKTAAKKKLDSSDSDDESDDKNKKKSTKQKQLSNVDDDEDYL